MPSRHPLDHPEILDRQVFHAGRIIFEEGDEGDCAYVIQKGAVDVVRDTDEGKIALGRLSPGSIFGEMALIDNSPRMATAVAVEATTVIVIKREHLREKIEKADPFIARLLCLLVGNVRNVTNAHVNRRPLMKWLDEENLDLDFEPEKVSTALTSAPFLRRDKASG